MPNNVRKVSCSYLLSFLSYQENREEGEGGGNLLSLNLHHRHNSSHPAHTMHSIWWSHGHRHWGGGRPPSQKVEGGRPPKNNRHLHS